MVKALLIKTTDVKLSESEIVEVRHENCDDIREVIGCEIVQLYYSKGFLDNIYLDMAMETKFEREIFVDEEGLSNGSECNYVAALVVNPLHDVLGLRIYGNCLVFRMDGSRYIDITRESVEQLRDAIWNNEELVELNCKHLYG
jgi:hypothetical protein